MKVEDVTIIGAGPAGLATAIQLKRYGIQPLLFERKKVGGLLWNANLVENYPGFPRGIAGPRLVRLFIRQAEKVGVKVTLAEVTEVSCDQGFLRVKTLENQFLSRVLMVATGTRPLHIGDLSIPTELTQKVFYEVYELTQLEGRSVVIIGGGDAAFDYALNLCRRNQVTILNRGDKPKCLPLLWDRSQKSANISYRHCAVVNKIMTDAKEGMLVDCQTPAGALQFQADYLLVAIGREACLDCLPDEFLSMARELEKKGVLYFIGDVANGIYRQTSIAVGEGVMAAMKIYRYLQENA